jgi:hypothetical protein
VAKGLAPFAAYLPGAEADFRDGEAGFAEGAVLHEGWVLKQEKRT